MRRIAVIALVALGVLTGCTPGPSPIAALVLIADGRVKLLLDLCGDEQLQDVFVSSDSGENWFVAVPHTNAGTGTGTGTEITLLERPRGWYQDSGGLTSFGPGRYGVVVSTSRGGLARHAQLEFTLDALRNLTYGQVLAADADGNTSPMSRKKFRERADDSC